MRLLPGEDEGLFRRFRERALEEIEPRDLIEEILVGDWIYYAWDVMRFQRYKRTFWRLRSERSAAIRSRQGGEERARAAGSSDPRRSGDGDVRRVR